MRGLECAAWGTATRDGEVRQSKAGNDFGIVNLAVSEGKTDDAGKEVSTYLKVLLFGALAQEASKISKGDRAYVEGSLSAAIYQHESGPRIDLSVRAFKFEKTGIGKNRKFPDRDGGKDIAARQLAESAFKREPYQRERPRVQGMNDDVWRDELPI